MNEREPFVLLDDIENGEALLLSGLKQSFVARRPEEVHDVLAAADAGRRQTGLTLAGYIAYEAGLAMEERLAPLASKRIGADGPLVWFGLFATRTKMDVDQCQAWLDSQGGGAKAGDADLALGPLEPQISLGAYEDACTTIQNAIAAGDIYQANLTFPLAGGYRGEPAAIYSALRGAAAAAHAALAYDGAHWLASLSPELFFHVAGQDVTVKPMKGTAPRSSDAELDTANASALAASAKDKAENLMIVDLMRNDLSRVCEPGSVSVDALFTIEHYPTVHQMVSTVSARLLPNTGPFDVLRALFPCGSVTGAPKIRAMELICAAERDPRGAYCGAIGMIDGNGDAAFNVAIRTLRLSEIENARGKAVMGVGSAIVADSAAMTEWRECLLKADFTRRAIGGFDLIETMRFEPEHGVELLELHLERMKASAAELGFSFDRHNARNRIQALCFTLEQPAKLRLVLSRSGVTALETQPLPIEPDRALKCIALPLPVDSSDFRLRHKTTDRGFYDEAVAAAHGAGADEALFVRDDGLITEGTFSNVFVQAKGEREGGYVTPSAELGLLPGVLRRSLMDAGTAREAPISLCDLDAGFMIGNSVRGLCAAELVA